MENKKDRLSTKAKKKAFIDAMRKSLGVRAVAMNAVQINSYQTITNWIKKDPKFAEELAEVENVTGDYVENALLKKIKDGDTTAIIFYCKTKLRNRGFIERTELVGKDNKDLINNIKIEICEPQREDNKTEE